jgi:hypothetical protein
LGAFCLLAMASVGFASVSPQHILTQQYRHTSHWQQNPTHAPHRAKMPSSLIRSNPSSTHTFHQMPVSHAETLEELSSPPPCLPSRKATKDPGPSGRSKAQGMALWRSTGSRDFDPTSDESAFK